MTEKRKKNNHTKAGSEKTELLEQYASQPTDDDQENESDLPSGSPPADSSEGDQPQKSDAGSQLIVEPSEVQESQKEQSDESTPTFPKRLPVLPLRDFVALPGMPAPLVISRPKSVKLVDDVVRSEERMLVLVAQRDPSIDDPGPKDLYEIGTAAIIVKMLKFPDGTTRILCQGLQRVHIERYVQEDPYLVADVEMLEEITPESIEVQALMKNVSSMFLKMLNHLPNVPEELKVAVMNIDDPGRLADMIAANLNVPLADRQKILEATNVQNRLLLLLNTLQRELEVLELGSKIQSEAQSKMNKTQREYYLREQLKAIQKELGEADEQAAEIEELRQKIEEANMPEEAKKEAMRELSRLERMHPAASEYTVARTYLDWLTALPWNVVTEDHLDIGKAKEVLDEDHYDLERIKDRILEYLAVRKLKSDMKGPILCFLGPPGVGKTSLGRSIARALGRKFVRISLGGVRDEAEIRGHRRTYVGALPGRIIQGLRKAESKNPVFMLDEIDKLGADFHGDPSSALLEVLDPEQNDSFSDHYLDVPFDLSHVMFITTANILDPIPPALLDRMEVLELPGYTFEEKLEIAKQFLIPKQLREHGIDKYKVRITDSATRHIIQDYTREAGVRNLEREIGTVCRKIARKITESPRKSKKKQIVVTQKDLQELLGPVKYLPEVAERKGEPGVCTGLAWTPHGGEILFIEATIMPGKGELILTGQLGDVMKESAQAALSYIRSRSDTFKLERELFAKSDIHVHVPSGAIPKDGPSAGVAIAVSLLSLLLKKPVPSTMAMTGEITLRGKILPVGGIKEKVLAARRAGITTVLLPDKNEKDLTEIPNELREQLEFVFVKTLDEVFSIVLDESKRKTQKKAAKKARKN